MINFSELHARTKTSLVYKYAFVFMVGALIPVILLGLWSFWMSYKSMHIHISESVYQVLKEKIDYTTLILQEAESLIANISGVEEISKSLRYETQAENDFNRLQMQAKIGYILSNYINIPGLESIDIFSAKGVQYHVGESLLPKTNEEILNQVQKLIAENVAAKKSVVWHGIRKNLNNPSQYSLIASKRLVSIDPETMEENYIGIIIIHYSVEAFNRKFAKAAKPGITHLVLDTQGNCIYSPLSESIGEPFYKYNRLDKQRSSDNFTDARYNGKKVFMLKFSSQQNNWTYFALLHPEYLRGVSRNFTNGTMVLLLLVLTVISTINVSYFRHMLHPIKEITNGLQGVSNGTYDLSVKLPNPHKDEIGELIRWFNNFTDDLIEKEKYRKELIQQKELAEKASEAKTVFLASISHELRTPLNGIIAIAELLDRTDLNKEQRDFLHTILQSSDILYALINHVLDYSKIASDKMELNPAVFDILPFCDKLSHIYSSQAQIKQLAYSYTKPNLPNLFVYADEIGIQKILINLLGNALKFTPKGKVNFDVSVDSITEESVNIRFTVADTGIGVVSEKRSLIFQAFEQADSDLAKSFEGSGLGLSIAQQLAKMMNTEITLESPNPESNDEFGPGSVFTFALCLPRTLPNADPAAMDKTIRASKTLGFTRKLACLIVEDNPINQRVLGSMLKKFNAESVVAANWEQCMAVIDQKTYDYIFMDIQMPGKTGLEITEMIRAKGIKTPIIAITGNALKEIEERAYACGMNAFLVKPIRNNELEEVIFRFYPQN